SASRRAPSLLATGRGGRDRHLFDARVHGAARALAGALDGLVVGRADVAHVHLDQRRAVHAARARTVVVHAALRAFPDLLLVGDVDLLGLRRDGGGVGAGVRAGGVLGGLRGGLTA